MPFERSRTCNYSAHVFPPMPFGFVLVWIHSKADDGCSMCLTPGATHTTVFHALWLGKKPLRFRMHQFTFAVMCAVQEREPEKRLPHIFGCRAFFQACKGATASSTHATTAMLACCDIVPCRGRRLDVNFYAGSAGSRSAGSCSFAVLAVFRCCGL